MEEDYITGSINPQQCRLRDMTYSAPISVNVEYTRGKEIVVRQGKDGVGAVNIGRIPLMLRCDRWGLSFTSQLPSCLLVGLPLMLVKPPVLADLEHMYDVAGALVS